MRKLLLMIPLVLIVTGCVQQGWVMTDSKNRTVVGEHIQVQFPKGWMQTKLPQGTVRTKKGKYVPMETLTATRDGIGLQSITAIKRFNKFAFPSIEKQLRPGMLAAEAADLYVTDLRKQSGLERLKVISTKPARVGNRQGFRVVSTFKNEDGLRIMIDTYGFVHKTGLYLIQYESPYLHYYKRDLRAFGGAVRTFKVTSKATGEHKASGLAGMFMAK